MPQRYDLATKEVVSFTAEQPPKGASMPKLFQARRPDGPPIELWRADGRRVVVEQGSDGEARVRAKGYVEQQPEGAEFSGAELAEMGVDDADELFEDDDEEVVDLNGMNRRELMTYAGENFPRADQWYRMSATQLRERILELEAEQTLLAMLDDDDDGAPDDDDAPDEEGDAIHAEEMAEGAPDEETDDVLADLAAEEAGELPR